LEQPSIGSEDQIERQDTVQSNIEQVSSESQIKINQTGKRLVELKLAGDRCMNQGNYPDAVKNYEEALKIDPKNAMLLELAGDALMKVQSYKVARVFYSNALEQDPSLLAVKDKIKMAEMRIRSNVVPPSDATNSPSINNKSNDASEKNENVLNSSANTSIELSTDRVLTDEERDDFYTLKLKGDRSLDNKNYEEAMQYYERAFKINKHNSSLLEKMGDLMNKVQNYVQAKSFYSVAAELEPSNSEIKRKLISLSDIDDDSDEEVDSDEDDDTDIDNNSKNSFTYSSSKSPYSSSNSSYSSSQSSYSSPKSPSWQNSYESQRNTKRTFDDLSESEKEEFVKKISILTGTPILRCHKCSKIISGRYYRETSRYSFGETVYCESCGRQKKAEGESDWWLRCICAIIIAVISIAFRLM